MRSVKKIRQHDMTDCAVACIAAIAEAYGLKMPLIAIRDACGASKGGTTIQGIVDACSKICLSARAFKSTDKDVSILHKINSPSILHFIKKNGDLHFVVFCKSEKKKLVIMDPADGEKHRMTENELKELWSGYIILIRPDADFKTGDSTVSIVSRFGGLLAMNRKDLSLAITGAIVYMIIGISTSLFIQQIIDNILPSKDFSRLTIIGTIMTFLAFSALFIGYCRFIFSIRAGIVMDCRLILKYLNHLFKLPVSFFSLRGSGELNSRIGDAMKIRSFLIEGITSIIISVLTLGVSFALMFTYYWKLALLTLMFIPAYVLLYYFSNKVNKRANRDIIESAASFEEKTVESITAVNTIKYFGTEGFWAARLEKQYIDLAGKLFKGGKYMGIFATSADAISKILTIVLLVSGSIFIFRGELSVGELISFYSMTAFFSSPLSQLVNINKEMTEVNISAKRLFEIMSLEEENEGGFQVTLDECYDLEFKDVTFSYPGNGILLDGFSEKIKSGQITAITGESGCGKSSLASLIMRGYKPQKGVITIKDIDINIIRMEQWRQYVSIVPQESILLNGSLIENISCGDPEPDLEKIVRIIKEIGMEKFIQSLPLGLMTMTGTAGCRLSGGQKQRIALARALYREPKILITDEATSSLDRESQYYILQKIRQLRDSGTSVIMITHKKDNIIIADKIIDMSARSEAKTC